MIQDDWYNDLMAERDRFETQNGELNVENQELRVRVEELEDALHKMTQQREGWSIIARQFARLRGASRTVTKMTMVHLQRQTKENVDLNMVVGAFIDDNLTNL
jgi:hypothetical protein